jgi:hypothetical protein
MAWLDRVDELPADDARERMREGLIRALSTRDARPAAGPLMVLQLRTVARNTVRWAAGNAIGVVAGGAMFARQMPVDALPRIGGGANRAAVVGTLIDLLADEDVALHAISAVGRMRARPAMERLLDHEHEAIRRRAGEDFGRLR